MDIASDKGSDRFSRRKFVVSTSALGAASLFGLSRTVAAEPPPETTRLRLIETPVICLAPQYLAEELLRAEGFTDVQYLKSLNWNEPIPAGEADISMLFGPPQVVQVDAGAPIVILAGGHVGCVTLIAQEGIRSTLGLKGKTIPVTGPGSDDAIFISMFISYVGLDAQRDVNWARHTYAEAVRLFEEGKVDALMAGPEVSLGLRARKVGHVLVDTTTDRPWAQYFCCLVTGNKEFVRRNPIATKRAVRALLKANDVCAAEPERTARLLMSKRLAPSYEYALQALTEMPYGQWRQYDPEDAVRFYALRLHETGMIRSSPQQIIARGTDWRFLNELKRELKA